MCECECECELAGGRLLKCCICTNKIGTHPIRLYGVSSLPAKLLDLVQREGVLSECQHWRRRTIKDNYLSDIYDGKIDNESEN